LLNNDTISNKNNEIPNYEAIAEFKNECNYKENNYKNVK
jgi:hypothetical protein